MDIFFIPTILAQFILSFGTDSWGIASVDILKIDGLHWGAKKIKSNKFS